MTDITPIISAALTLIAAIITTFLVPFIRSKLDTEQMEKLRVYIETAVEAAEMIYTGTGMGETKKKYVLEYLEHLGVSLDSDTLDNLIESAVLRLKKSA